MIPKAKAWFKVWGASNCPYIKGPQIEQETSQISLDVYALTSFLLILIN